MADTQHLMVPINGINIHAASCGEGPLVLMLHGFPGLWYSWRKQMSVIADAGYQAVAIDKRGFGRSDRPTDLAGYSHKLPMCSVCWIISVPNKP